MLIPCKALLHKASQPPSRPQATAVIQPGRWMETQRQTGVQPPAPTRTQKAIHGTHAPKGAAETNLQPMPGGALTLNRRCQYKQSKSQTAGTIHVLLRLRLTNVHARRDCCGDRLSNFEVKVGNTDSWDANTKVCIWVLLRTLIIPAAVWRPVQCRSGTGAGCELL